MTTEDSSPIPHETQQVIQRYRNGYRVANTLDSAGQFAQAIGFIIFLGGIAYCIFGPSGVVTWIAGVFSVIFAIILGLLATLISAVGQGIKASFDTAVHTSPFLTEGQKAVAMSL